MTDPSSSPQGVLICDKAQGLTSHGVVSRIRRWFHTRKVGHAGTLDPMATGVLVLGLGRGTKLLTHITGVSKTYTATIRLGSATPTDDADSEPDLFADPATLAAVTPADIEAAVDRLRGPIDQVPSAVSAIKVDGVRSYARVRAGEDVVLKARRITVSRFDILDIRFDAPSGRIDVDVIVDCSSGTYIRALARDLGTSLDVHGHLIALRRTRVGPFDLTSAVTIPEDLDSPAPRLLTLAEAAAALLPTVAVDRTAATALMQGKIVPAEAVAESAPDAAGAAAELSADGVGAVLEPGTEVAVLLDADDGSGPELVSVATVRDDGGLKSTTAFAIHLV